MATNDPGEEWAEELVRRVGTAAKKLRGKRSARWLAERTAELGYPISPQVIARLDAGRRAGHLELAELLVIAAALEVPPALLLLPGVPDDDVEVLPGLRARSDDALAWVCGERDYLYGRDGDVGAAWPSRVHQSIDLLAAVRERLNLDELSLTLDGLAVRLDQVHEDHVDDTLVAKVKGQFAEVERRYMELNAKIRELGGTVNEPESQAGGPQPPF